jgi:hypothetical protein
MKGHSFIVRSKNPNKKKAGLLNSITTRGAVGSANQAGNTA